MHTAAAPLVAQVPLYENHSTNVLAAMFWALRLALRWVLVTKWRVAVFLLTGRLACMVRRFFRDRETLGICLAPFASRHTHQTL